MKRTRLAKKSKSLIRKIQDELWQECRRIVFNRDSKNGEVDCYTCPAKNLQSSNKQLGHVPDPKSVLPAFCKYDLKRLKYQCWNCNINHGGMGGAAQRRMEKEFGKEYMEQLEKDRQVTVKAIDFYVELLEKYKTM